MNQLQPLDAFLQAVGTAMRNRMNLSPYFGQTWECACGDAHDLSVFNQILFQGYWKIAIVCPIDESYLTLVKIKIFTFRRNRSLVSLTGTQVQTDIDRLLLASVLSALR